MEQLTKIRKWTSPEGHIRVAEAAFKTRTRCVHVHVAAGDGWEWVVTTGSVLPVYDGLYGVRERIVRVPRTIAVFTDREKAMRSRWRKAFGVVEQGFET